jgi:GAF domain-containing protein
VIPVSNDAEQRALHRQALTAQTFVEIVDTLVDDFDVIEVLTVLTSRSVELLEAAAAGILLADTEGHLRVIGASSEKVGLLELFQIQNDEGPCLDCYHTGAIVLAPNLTASSPWPNFAAESVRSGFPSVCAVPLRLKDLVLGCLNLFMAEPVGLSDAEVALAQALADVASIAIIQDMATREAAVREGHLQHALNSRIVIEQAKGMIAERSAVDMDEAFARLRAFARNNNRGLTEVAEGLVSGSLAVDSFTERRSHGDRRRPPPPPPPTRQL